MASIIYLHDDDTGTACAVNADTFTPLPIVGVGPNAVGMVQGFVEACPFDVTTLDADSMRAAFLSHLEQTGAFQPAVGAVLASPDMDAGAGPSPDGAGKLEDATAAAGPDMPATQPADTDNSEGPPTITVTKPCWNCDGEGTVTFGDGSPSRPCGICKGTGKVQQEVPA